MASAAAAVTAASAAAVAAASIAAAVATAAVAAASGTPTAAAAARAPTALIAAITTTVFSRVWDSHVRMRGSVERARLHWAGGMPRDGVRRRPERHLVHRHREQPRGPGLHAKRLRSAGDVLVLL